MEQEIRERYKHADYSREHGKNQGPSKPRIDRLKPLLHQLTEINNKRRRD